MYDYDLSKLLKVQHAALVILEEALDNVEHVHPCDQHNDDIKIKQLPQSFQDLYTIFKE